jgi:hypothetical protein
MKNNLDIDLVNEIENLMDDLKGLDMFFNACEVEGDFYEKMLKEFEIFNKKIGEWKEKIEIKEEVSFN